MRRNFRYLAMLVLPMLYPLPTSADEHEGLEEVIVTAQKIEQNLEDVPSSVSVLPGSLIEESGADNISDLNGTVPNVILQDMVFITNTANMAIRGIGFFDTDPFADQKTQVLVDGIPHARVTGLGHDQIDVERVEILRGPQGTLFGRNSLAGTVNIITRAADQDPGIAVRAAVGEYGLSKFVVSAESGEVINDSLRTRLTVSKRNYDGHITNAFNGNRLGVQDSNMLRLKLDHSISNVATTLTYYRVDEESDGIATSNVIQDPYGTADGDVHLVNMDTDGFNNSNESGFTLLSDIEFESGTVYIAANSHDSDFLLYTDLDGRAGAQPPARGPNPRLNVNIGFDIDHGQDSVEIRFHDAHSSRWDYVLGVFTFRESARRFFYQNIGPPFSATFAFEDAARTTIAEQRTNSIAAFAQTDFRLNDRFVLIAGGRITQDEKDVTVSNFGLPAPAPQRPPIVLNAKTTWDQPTWRLGTKYEYSDSLMGYATISTGYKSGGFTSRATVPENVGPYDAEYVTNYESGVKANLFSNHLRLSAAVFYADYEDLVGFVRRTNATGRGNEPINENLGDVDIKGLEFESDWLLRPNLNVDFAVGLLDAKWRNFAVDLNNDGIVTDNSDLDVLMAPSLTAYGAINYTSYLRESALDFRIEARYQSRYNSFGESNDEIFYRPGTTMVNGSIKLTWGARGNGVSLFGRNLTDKDAPKLTIGASIFPVAVYEPPRVLGVELRLNI
ncbi:MAG: TonB-dependent receptor [Gammaproteobacteria bacterium]|nr:TonB-dependent receptor [Gammaproteobacteria bacterium]